jgi:hypothetical protein
MRKNQRNSRGIRLLDSARNAKERGGKAGEGRGSEEESRERRATRGSS